MESQERGGHTKAMMTAMIVILSTFFADPLSATHGHWIDHYLAADSITRCCGPRDCLQVPLRLVHANGDHVTLDIQGVPVTILRKAFHISEDAFDYLCLKDVQAHITAENIRCAFIAVGG